MEGRQGYRLPLSYVLRFALAVILGRRREVGPDATAVLQRAGPPCRILGQEHVPLQGPFVLVANHYERPGLKVFWGGMLLTAAVWQRRGQSPRWLMTSEWYNFRLGPLPVPVWLLRWLFRRLATVYDLVIVPRAPERGVGRAAALRAVLQAASPQGRPLALFPEGIGSGCLLRPPEGVGLLLLALAERGVPCLPAGLYEEEGHLVARFGRPFLVRGEGEKEERFRQARDQAMLAIGSLLPSGLWGEYAADLQRLMERGEHLA
jgi:1-acyl-sn-glycerol-3-phosphate acyltransferase